MAKGPFLYYVRVKGWVGGIAKYLLFLTRQKKPLRDFDVTRNTFESK